MASSAADRPSLSAIGWEPAVGGIDPADRHFGGFEVLRRVARCGATEVHLARRKDRHQVVALKRLGPVHRDDAAQRRALRAEGDFLLRVRHPGLCSVVEAGDVDDEPFLALEHLRGATLAALEGHALRTGDPLDARLVLSVAVHVCRVVHWLHGLREQTDGLVGGVHQALTPSHVFVTTGGAVKLLDLGAALDAPHLRLERIGLAEQRYRAPEVQGGGGASDPRSDVFAIGASVLEALAAGEAPWTASSDADPLRRAASFFLDRAVAEDPERRFQNVAVLEHATIRVLAKNGGLASMAELGALATAVIEGGRSDSSPEISWPALGRGEADSFADRTVEIPLPAELARMDESVDEVTLLAVRAAAGPVEDPDDPVAEAPVAADYGDEMGADIEDAFDDERATLGRGGLALPAPPEQRVTFDRADTARPTFESPAIATPVPALRDSSARRWKLAFCALAVAVVSAAVVLGGGDRISGRPLGEPMVSALVRAAEPARREPDFTSRVSEALAVPVTTPPPPAFTPAAVPAATEGSPLAADPTPWQAVRRRWATCVEKADCGAACQGRFSILIDDGGVPYSVESSAGEVPAAVSSCLIGVTRRSKDLRRLLAKLGVSELTWSPTRAPAVGETAPTSDQGATATRAEPQIIEP
jgi:hypothetical protein